MSLMSVIALILLVIGIALFMKLLYGKQNGPSPCIGCGACIATGKCVMRQKGQQKAPETLSQKQTGNS